MEALVQYNSLKDAIQGLNRVVGALESPIDKYMVEAKRIGLDGEAWGGTPAENVVDVLEKIKGDINRLRSAVDTYSDSVNKAGANYATQDKTATGQVRNVIQS